MYVKYIFLVQLIRISDFFILSQKFLSYTCAILPRLSQEDCSLAVLELTHMVAKWHQCIVKVTSSCNNNLHLRNLEAYFNGEQWKIIHYLCEGGIEKSVPDNSKVTHPVDILSVISAYIPILIKHTIQTLEVPSSSLKENNNKIHRLR